MLWDGVGKLLGNRRVTKGQWTASANANLLQFSVADITLFFQKATVPKFCRYTWRKLWEATYFSQPPTSFSFSCWRSAGLQTETHKIVRQGSVQRQKDREHKVRSVSWFGRLGDPLDYRYSISLKGLIHGPFSPKFENYTLPKRNVYLVKQWELVV